MKNKGFTLIELLATLVILSIIMLVAVPSTLSILDKNKKDSFISDAKRLVALVENEVRNNDEVEIGSNEAMIFRFDDVDDGSFSSDPDGTNYDASKSYIAVFKNTTYEADGVTVKSYQYEYYVQLLGGKRGISLIESRSIASDSVVSLSSVDSTDMNTKTNNVIKSNTGKTATNIIKFGM